MATLPSYANLTAATAALAAANERAKQTALDAQLRGVTDIEDPEDISASLLERRFLAPAWNPNIGKPEALPVTPAATEEGSLYRMPISVEAEALGTSAPMLRLSKTPFGRAVGDRVSAFDRFLSSMNQVPENAVWAVRDPEERTRLREFYGAPAFAGANPVVTTPGAQPSVATPPVAVAQPGAAEVSGPPAPAAVNAPVPVQDVVTPGTAENLDGFGLGGAENTGWFSVRNPDGTSDVTFVEGTRPFDYEGEVLPNFDGPVYAGTRPGGEIRPDDYFIQGGSRRNVGDAYMPFFLAQQAQGSQPTSATARPAPADPIATQTRKDLNDMYDSLAYESVTDPMSGATMRNPRTDIQGRAAGLMPGVEARATDLATGLLSRRSVPTSALRQDSGLRAQIAAEVLGNLPNDAEATMMAFAIGKRPVPVSQYQPQPDETSGSLLDKRYGNKDDGFFYYVDEQGRATDPPSDSEKAKLRQIMEQILIANLNVTGAL